MNSKYETEILIEKVNPKAMVELNVTTIEQVQPFKYLGLKVPKRAKLISK